MKKKIAFDLSPLGGDSIYRGIGRVIVQSIKHLLLNDDFNENFSCYFITTNKEIPINLNLSPYILVNSRKELTDFLKKEKIDLYHCFGNFLPKKDKKNNTKIVTTFYDAIPLLLLKKKINYKSIILTDKLKYVIFNWIRFFVRPMYNIFLYLKYQLNIKKIINNTDCFFHISKTTKCDFLKYYPKAVKKQHEIVYLGVEFKESSSNEDTTILNKLGLEKNKYFYYIGGFDKRKNIMNLISIYNDFIKKNPDYLQYKLVLIGKISNPIENHIKYLAKKRNIEKNIVITNYLSDFEAEKVIVNSKMLLFPSLYEGFGLPILEAMFYKKPVIAFKNSSIEELFNGAAYLANNNDNDDFSKKMEDLINNEDLYKEFVEKGFLKQQNFRWLKTAQEMLLRYKRILN